MNPTSDIQIQQKGGGNIIGPPIPAPGPMPIPVIVPPKPKRYPPPIPGRIVTGGSPGPVIIPKPNDVNPPIIITGGGGSIPPVPRDCPPCPPCNEPKPIIVPPPVPPGRQGPNPCRRHQAPHGYYFAYVNGQCILTRRAGGFGSAPLVWQMGNWDGGDTYSDFFGSGSSNGGDGGGGVSENTPDCRCTIGTAYRDQSGACACRDTPGGNVINSLIARTAAVTSGQQGLVDKIRQTVSDNPLLSIIAAVAVVKLLKSK